MLQRLHNNGFLLITLVLGPVFWWLNSSFQLSRAIEDDSWLFWVMLVGIYPVLEELCFRGALQGYLLSRVWGRAHFSGLSVANGLTSAVFVGFHLMQHSVWWALAIFVPSLIFGVLREHYRNLLPCVLVHAYYNFGFFVTR